MRKPNLLFRILLSILLVGIGAVCVGGIVFFAREAVQKESKRRLLSQDQMSFSQAAAQNEPSGITEAGFTGQGAVNNVSVQAENIPEDNTALLQVSEPTTTPEPPVVETWMAGNTVLHPGYEFTAVSPAVPTAEDVYSKNALLVDLSTDQVIAERDASARINPASMTKVLTVLVAAEQIPDLDASFTVTQEMEVYCLQNECSAAGFKGGETVPIRDLFYGTVLPSGGEAAVALATCAAGSHEAFVALMNEKLDQLGISDTAHFTNCVGIYDPEHYCTLYDMAVIMKAALQNDWAREVLSEKVHITTTTEQNPEGLVLCNWFLRRIEDFDCGGEVLSAKTGFVNESGFCCVSYDLSNSGIPYICVTADTYSEWRSIYDHIALYKNYAV